jgi:hypothetical protein
MWVALQMKVEDTSIWELWYNLWEEERDTLCGKTTMWGAARPETVMAETCRITQRLFGSDYFVHPQSPEGFGGNAVTSRAFSTPMPILAEHLQCEKACNMVVHRLSLLEQIWGWLLHSLCCQASVQGKQATIQSSSNHSCSFTPAGKTEWNSAWKLPFLV